VNIAAPIHFGNDLAGSPLNFPLGFTLTHVVIETLGKSIVAGRYPEEGTTVTEGALCRQFEVGRGTLREAVRALRSKGLVDLRPRHGLWVQPENCWNLLDVDILRWLLERKPSLSLVMELTEMRLAVEPSAARHAAFGFQHGASKDSVHAIGCAARNLRETGAVEQLIGFHTAILHATRNRFFAQSADIVGAAIRLNNHYLNGTLCTAAVDASLLDAIGGKLLSGDGDGAEQGLRALIESELALLVAYPVRR
jgi:DNA-binding FadR family transcriptional regulator